MRSLSFMLTIVALSVAVTGCSTPRPTPPEVHAAYRALLDSLDHDRPAASATRLTDFMKANSRYQIATEIESEIDRLRTLAEGRYHEARELARKGDFDRAEAMLEDLAIHLPETSDGESAKGHLAFDFYLGKAQWLMVRQRWEESRAVARPLLERDLTPAQQDQVEAILDAAGHADAALSQAERLEARAACRQLVILLETRYVEEGQYPSRFSLADVKEWDPYGSRSVLRALSAIEGYRRTDRGYSFVAVSNRTQHRIRVVDGAIEG